MQRAEPLGDGAVLLHELLSASAAALLADIGQALEASPWRHMQTPAGRRMSVAMSNCGAVGWVSDRRGYRYEPVDPLTGRPWPALTRRLRDAARTAARLAGYPDFEPDVCLMNHYEPGAQLTLHQDRDERDATAPIVSISLGLPARFLFGGLQRRAPVRRVTLRHGDVVVWGGPSRLAYHGIAPLAAGTHALLGACRVNLTFRRAL